MRAATGTATSAMERKDRNVAAQRSPAEASWSSKVHTEPQTPMLSGLGRQLSRLSSLRRLSFSSNASVTLNDTSLSSLSTNSIASSIVRTPRDSSSDESDSLLCWSSGHKETHRQSHRPDDTTCGARLCALELSMEGQLYV